MPAPPYRDWLLAFADGVSDAATRAGPAAIAKAKARELEISYFVEGQVLIESADGDVRSHAPMGQDVTK